METVSTTDHGRAPVVAPGAGLHATRLRYDWYRDMFRASMTLNLVLSAALVLMGGAVAYLYQRIPNPEYFATTQDNRLIKLVPLSEPNLSSAALLQWAVEAVNNANNYNFANYRGSLQAVCNESFTKEGCKAYLAALDKTGNLEAVKKRRLVVTAQVIKAPIITRYGTRGGIHFWDVQLLALVTFQSSSATSTQRQIIDLTVVRTPTLESQRGVAISRYIAQFAGKI